MNLREMRDIIIIGNSSLAFSSGNGLQASQAPDTDSWGLQEGDSEAGEHGSHWRLWWQTR